MANIVPITTDEQLLVAFAIRRAVFIDEQAVPEPEEFDKYEQTSTHLLAYAANGTPCGTSRWRLTSEGAKLERFAVLKQYRGQGVGYALIAATLQSIEQSQPNAGSLRKYLYAQLDVVPLYERFGFNSYGPHFDDAGIPHVAMELLPQQ